MKTLYFECGMGAAGDMLMAALLELCSNRDDFLRRLNSAGIPNVVVTAEASEKCGIVGTRVRVAVGGREESVEHHSHVNEHHPHHNHNHNHGDNDDNHHDEHHHHHHDDNHHDNHHDEHHHHHHDDNHDNEHHHHHHDDNHHDEHHHHHHDDNHDNEHHHHHHDDNHHDEHHHHHHDDNHDNEHHHHNHDEHHHPHHSHNSHHEIEHLINRLNINDTVKKNALGVYKILAEAESRAHGVTVDKIHFHEVGEADAVADIVGVCMLVDELAPDLIFASPVNLGGGYVRCAHGLLPVPAPATANILQNIPVYGGGADGELCTPTGAALLKHFVKEFRGMPLMTVRKTGYGMGTKEFERANCLRAYIGDIDNIKGNGLDICKSQVLTSNNGLDICKSQVLTDNNGLDICKSQVLTGNNGLDICKSQVSTDDNGLDICNEENIAELSCNLDDMTPEAVSFAQRLLLDEGALDVYTTPIGMKKSRAGLMFTCLCRLDEREKMLRLMFKHTTTLGIREYITRRYILNREDKEIQTPIGSVRIKTARGFGAQKSKPEYEDAARIARERGLSIEDVLAEIAAKIAETE